MRNALLAERVGHARHLHAPNHAAEIKHVLLHNRQAAIGNQPAEVVRARLLLPTRNWNLKRVRHRLRLLVPVERHRLLVERVLVLLHQLANRNSLAPPYKNHWSQPR